MSMIFLPRSLHLVCWNKKKELYDVARLTNPVFATNYLQLRQFDGSFE